MSNDCNHNESTTDQKKYQPEIIATAKCIGKTIVKWGKKIIHYLEKKVKNYFAFRNKLNAERTKEHIEHIMSMGAFPAHAGYTYHYLEILQAYRLQLTWSFRLKQLMKFIFLGFMLYIMSSSIKQFALTIGDVMNLVENISSSNGSDVAVIGSVVSVITSIVASFATVIVEVISIPKIIAKYLFNKKEDESLVTMIQKIQDYEINFMNLDSEASRQAAMEIEKNGGVDEKDLKQMQYDIPSDCNNEAS